MSPGGGLFQRDILKSELRERPGWTRGSESPFKSVFSARPLQKSPKKREHGDIARGGSSLPALNASVRSFTRERALEGKEREEERCRGQPRHCGQEEPPFRQNGRGSGLPRRRATPRRNGEGLETVKCRDESDRLVEYLFLRHTAPGLKRVWGENTHKLDSGWSGNDGAITGTREKGGLGLEVHPGRGTSLARL